MEEDVGGKEDAIRLQSVIRVHIDGCVIEVEAQKDAIPRGRDESRQSL